MTHGIRTLFIFIKCQRAFVLVFWISLITFFSDWLNVFLDASSHLYKWAHPSFYLPLCWSVYLFFYGLYYYEWEENPMFRPNIIMQSYNPTILPNNAMQCFTGLEIWGGFLLICPFKPFQIDVTRRKKSFKINYIHRRL